MTSLQPIYLVYRSHYYCRYGIHPLFKSLSFTTCSNFLLFNVTFPCNVVKYRLKELGFQLSRIKMFQIFLSPNRWAIISHDAVDQTKKIFQTLVHCCDKINQNMRCIFCYLDSMFCVEVRSPQTCIQVVTQGLQSLHGGQQLALILRNTQNKMVISNIVLTERVGLMQSIWMPPVNYLHFQQLSVLKTFQLASVH